MGLATTEDLAAITISFIKSDWQTSAKKKFITTKTANYTIATIGSGASKFRKDSLVAGRFLVFCAAYQGKREGVILQFKQQDLSGQFLSQIGDFVEIPLKQIPNLTTDYADFLRTLLGRDHLPSQEEKEMTDQLNNSIYGHLPGWGEFA